MVRHIVLAIGAVLATAAGTGATSVVTNANGDQFINAVTLGNNECNDEIMKQCGNEIHNLQKDIHDFEFSHFIQDTQKVLTCLNEKKEKINKKCSNLNIIADSAHDTVVGGPCEDIVDKLCGAQMKKLTELLASGAAPQDIVRGCRDLISCLIKHDSEIAPKCGPSSSLQDEKKPCKKILEKKCGKDLDDLEKAIKDTSIKGIISSALGLSGCIIENFGEIAKECSPVYAEDEELLSEDAVEEYPISKEKEGKCHKELYAKCGTYLKQLKQDIKDTALLGIIGSSLEVAGCVTINAQDLIKTCLSSEDSQMLSGMINQPALRNGEDDKKPCKNTLEKKCGKQLDALKKVIDEPSVNGIATATIAVASCIVENFEDIAKQCSPFEQVMPLQENSLPEVTEKEGKCHKELYAKCGTYLKQLKQDIKDTNILGIVGSSLEVSGCVTINAQDLIQKCFESDDLAIEAINIQDCINRAKKDCKKELDSITSDIEDHKFREFASDLPKLAQCVSNHAEDIKKSCVKNVMDVSIRALFDSHHHHHSNQQESPAMIAFNGGIASAEYYADLKDPKSNGPHGHRHMIVVPIIASLAVFLVGFLSGKYCRRPRICKKNENPGQLSYEAIAGNDLSQPLKN